MVADLHHLPELVEGTFTGNPLCLIRKKHGFLIFYPCNTLAMIFPWNAGWHHLKTCTSSSADMRFQHLQQPDRSPITSARGATSEVVWNFRGNHGWTRGKSHFKGKSMKIHENPIPSTGKSIKNSWWNLPFRHPEDSRVVRREFRVFHWAPVAHCWPVASEAGNHGENLAFEPQKTSGSARHVLWRGFSDWEWSCSGIHVTFRAVGYTLQHFDSWALEFLW